MGREGIQMYHKATIGQLITKVAGFYYINESQQGSSDGLLLLEVKILSP